MKISEIITEAVKQRLDAKCWAGKHKEGTKVKGGVRVNNCVPNESIKEGLSNDMSAEDMIAYLRQHHDTNLHQDYLNHINTFSKFVLQNIPVNSIKTDLPGLDKEKVEQYKQLDFSKAPPIVMGSGYILDGYHRATVAKALGIPTIKAYVGAKGQQPVAETAAWKRKEGKNKKGGLNQKGVDSYRKEHPGSKLQTAVTTKPSKLKPGSKDAKRRKSFCARMSGMKGPMKKPNGDPTRKALALRKWHCESVEHFVEMFCENMDHSKDNQAVPELKAALIAQKSKLQAATEDQVYDIIDSIMTRIAKSHGISGQKLHDMWVKEYDQIPDTWIMK